MNEAARTEVQMLIQAALDFIGDVDTGEDDQPDPSDLKDAIARVLPYVYG
jgi:hypothetical protein